MMDLRTRSYAFFHLQIDMRDIDEEMLRYSDDQDPKDGQVLPKFGNLPDERGWSHLVHLNALARTVHVDPALMIWFLFLLPLHYRS